MRSLFAVLLLLPSTVPDEIDRDKVKLREACSAGNRTAANRAAESLVGHQDARSAPALASALREGLTLLSKLKRERAKLEEELEKWKLRRDEKGNRLGDIEKWRDAKFKYDPLTSRIESMEAALSHTITYMLRLESRDAAKGLVRVLEGGTHWVARAYAAEALGRLDHPIALSTLLLTAKTAVPPALQVALAEGLASKTRISEEARDLMVKWLDSKYWQVRLAAAQALAVSEDRTRAFALINQMAVEKGRMLYELDKCLEKLTGVAKSSSYAVWKAWWDTYRDVFLEGKYEAPESERVENERRTVFFGVPLISERVVFVLDASSSMKRPIKWQPDALNDPERPKGDRTLDVAKYELKKIIRRLPNDARFNIVLMRHKTESLAPRMLRAGSSRKRAIQYAEDIRVEPGTNIWLALLRCLDFAGGGWTDRLRKDSIDSIYLVSDGEHTNMLVDRIQVMERGLEALRFKKIAVYSIAVNAPAHGGFLLKTLAEGTGGTFVQR